MCYIRLTSAATVSSARYAVPTYTSYCVQCPRAFLIIFEISENRGIYIVCTLDVFSSYKSLRLTISSNQNNLLESDDIIYLKPILVNAKKFNKY